MIFVLHSVLVLASLKNLHDPIQKLQTIRALRNDRKLRPKFGKIHSSQNTIDSLWLIFRQHHFRSKTPLSWFRQLEATFIQNNVENGKIRCLQAHTDPDILPFWQSFVEKHIETHACFWTSQTIRLRFCWHFYMLFCIFLYCPETLQTQDRRYPSERCNGERVRVEEWLWWVIGN